MRLLFTGFNGFGQHEFVNGNATADSNAGFREINAPLTDKNQCTISIAWRYSALALGRKLWLRGLLAECPDECVTLEAAGDIKALAAGDTHCLVLLHNGQLYRVKPNLNAELVAVRLEDPPRSSSNSGTKRSIFGIPKAPELPALPIVEHIACGSHINVAVSSENAVYSIPSCLHQFPGRQFRVEQLECGHEHAVLLNGNGDVFTWGNGLRGQLGQAVLKVEEAPLLVEALAGIKITRIAAGGWHSAAISAFGDLYTWGLNCSGQLGVRVMKPGGLLKEPTVYPLPQLHDLSECGCSTNSDADDDCAPLGVFAGSRHTLVIRRCGGLWATGWRRYSQLGKQLHLQQQQQKNLSYSDVFQPLEGITLDTSSDSVLCGPWSTVIFFGKKLALEYLSSELALALLNCEKNQRKSKSGGLKANKDCMEPSLFFVLFWRLAVDVLYPYSYMDSFLEDALGNDHLVWTPGSRITRHLLTVTRDAFRTILMMVLLMEMFQGLDAALNIPAAANRRRRH